MAAFPDEPLKIDWAAYKNKIAVPGFVDNFEKLYNAVKIPYPEDKYSSAIDKHETEIVISIFLILYITFTYYINVFLNFFGGGCI